MAVVPAGPQTPALRRLIPSTYLKKDPYLKKVMSEPPKCCLYSLLSYRLFKPLLNYQHGRLWRSFFKIRFQKQP